MSLWSAHFVHTVSQLASYFAQDSFRVRYPQMTHGKCVTTFSVSDTATAHVYSVPGYPFTNG